MAKEQLLEVNDQTLAQLHALKAKSKFVQDGLYPGAGSETTRRELDNKINALIDRLSRNIKNNPKKSFVLNEFKITLSECIQYDTENRERICHYLEEIMDIFKIESSDGLLNKWMYDFDPSE